MAGKAMSVKVIRKKPPSSIQLSGMLTPGITALTIPG